MEVLRDYFSSGMSMISTAKKWGLTSHTYILRWLKCYPIDSDLLSLSPELLSELQMKKNPKSKKNSLKRKICVFERRWNLKKLRSHAFQKLIELTEKEEGISILKKDGAK